MKRFIVTVSLSLSAVFALALANTPDAASSNGDAPGETAQESAPPAGGNFCTDFDGIIYRRGQAGFERCRAERDREQGGEAGTEGTGTGSDTTGDTPPPQE
jgi:hypothetical protein